MFHYHDALCCYQCCLVVLLLASPQGAVHPICELRSVLHALMHGRNLSQTCLIECSARRVVAPCLLDKLKTRCHLLANWGVQGAEVNRELGVLFGCCSLSGTVSDTRRL